MKRNLGQADNLKQNSIDNQNDENGCYGGKDNEPYDYDKSV